MLRTKQYVYGDERFHVPSHLHFGKEILDRMIEYGDHPALINADDDEIITFSQLAQKTVDVALSLTRIGVRKGDVVSVCSEKRMEVIPTILGVFCVGGVFAATDIEFSSVPLRHRLEIGKPKVMFLSAKGYDLHKPTFDAAGVEKYIVYGAENKDGAVLFKEFLTETADVADFFPTPVEGWKDLVFILFSSGTTGLPKGVPWTHLALLVNSDSCSNESFKYSSILITREWYFTYGLFITISCLKRGTTCVYSPRNQELDCLLAIQKYQVRVLQSAPSSINQLIKSKILNEYDVTSIEYIMSSSTPVMKEQVEAVKIRFPNLRGVYQIYGTSEAGNVCNELHAPLGPKDGSVGTASFGFIIKVVDLNTGEPLGANQRGEIRFKSPSLTPGYIGMEEGSHLDSEGFYKSGDVGYFDDDKYFYVINRVKELIKYNDFSVAPAEFEAILVREPRVRDAGVTSSRGLVAALVVLQPHTTANPRELEDFLHDNITHTSRLRLSGGAHIVTSLPRGAGDKLDRVALQRAYTEILDKHNTQPTK